MGSVAGWLANILWGGQYLARLTESNIKKIMIEKLCTELEFIMPYLKKLF